MKETNKYRKKGIEINSDWVEYKSNNTGGIRNQLTQEGGENRLTQVKLNQITPVEINQITKAENKSTDTGGKKKQITRGKRKQIAKA